MTRPLSAKEARSDEGSLAVAMLLIVLGTMLAALLVPVTITQVNASKFDTRRSHSIDAAQSGLQVMLGQIRGAGDSNSNGNRSSLPCTSASSPLTGSVSSTGNEAYQAWVYYFTQDPQGHDDWLDNPSQQIACAKNKGPSQVPSFAVVKSQGTDNLDGSFTANTRTVLATYTFKFKNTNVPGGLIYADQASPQLCLDAGPAPIANTVVKLQKCSAGSVAQTWAFLPNSTVNLTSTADRSAGTLGLCLDAPFNTSGVHTNGQSIVLRNCSTTTIPEQEWTYGGYGNNWHATTTATRRDDNMCWNAQSPNTAGANVVLGGCTSAAFTYEAARSFIQDASVGAGNADAAHHFLVNYNQFGRCASVNWVVGPTPHIDPSDSNYLSFLQSYPCSPVPEGDTQDQPLNQLFNFPTVAAGATSATGQWTSTTTLSGNTYCMFSDRTVGSYPRTDKCTSTKFTATQKQWTVYGDTGDYATSYQIKDSAGLCLQAADPSIPNNPDVFGSGKISKIIMTTCSSSTLQKWDAPPGITPSQVTGYHEQ